MEEAALLSIGETRDRGFFETVLDTRGDFHGISGVAEKECVLRYPGSVEGVICALRIEVSGVPLQQKENSHRER
jgi:hypothetical protein